MFERIPPQKYDNSICLSCKRDLLQRLIKKMRNLYPVWQPSNKEHNTIMSKICEIVEARMAVIKDLVHSAGISVGGALINQVFDATILDLNGCMTGRR